MPEVSDPSILAQLNGGNPRAAPQPVVTLPNYDQQHDNAVQDIGVANDAVRTDIAQQGNTRAIQDQGFAHANDLRKQYDANKDVQDYHASVKLLDTGIKAAGTKDGAGDLTLIYAYAKMMDPTTGVREGEMANAQTASPWVQAKVQELKGNLDGSGRLPDAMRGNLVNQMVLKGQGFRKSYSLTRQRYTEDAGAFGIDPARVIGPDFGQPYFNDFRAYDQQRMGGAGGQQQSGGAPDGIATPDMTGGLPTGTQIQFGDSKPTEAFDRATWLKEHYGINSDQEEWIRGFWNSNLKNTSLTVDGVRSAMRAQGLGAYIDRVPDAELQAHIDGTVKGRPTGYFDTSQAKQEYEAKLKANLQNEGFDPNSGSAYLDRAARGTTMGARDEFAGIDAAAGALWNGDNPVDAYRMARDTDRLRAQQEADAQGIPGHVAEFAGSIPTMVLGPGGEVKTVADAAKAGVGYGAVAGFNSGDGLSDSIRTGIMGGIMGGGAGAGLQKAAPVVASGFKRILPGRSVSPAAQNYAEAQAFGLEPSLGDVGGMGAKVVERGLDVQPGSATTMNNARSKLTDQLTTATDNVAGTFGKQADQRGIGQALQRGAKGWVDDFHANSARNYEAIPIAPDVKASTGETIATLRDLTSKITGNDELAKQVTDKRLIGYLDAFKKGALSWNDLKQFRTMIGEEMGQAMFGEKTLKSDLRKLYGALSKDMEQTAKSQGDVAYKAFRKANDYHAQGERRIEGAITDLLGKDGKNSIEDAAAFIQRISKSGKGSSDLAKLAQIRKTLKPDEWGQVANGIIRLAGRPVNSEGRTFSPQTFIKTFEDMAPGAKNILFGTGELRANLDKFAGVVQRIAQNDGTRNVSRTAMGLSGAVGYGAGGAPGLAAQTLLSYGGAKAWTNPGFIRWATGYTKMIAAAQKSGQINPAAHEGQMQALTRLASSNPAIAGEARELQQQLMAVFGAGPERLAASPDQSGDKPTNIPAPQ